jgi:hypothetical protein
MRKVGRLAEACRESRPKRPAKIRPSVAKIGFKLPRRLHPVPEEAIMRIAQPRRAGRRQLWFRSGCKRGAAARHAKNRQSALTLFDATPSDVDTP